MSDDHTDFWGKFVAAVLIGSTGLWIYLLVNQAAWYWVAVACIPDGFVFLFLTWLGYHMFIAPGGNVLD